MDLTRAVDEEIVAVCENDSCAVDALQVLLGTAAGKGNLIIKDFGKNAYTVLSRSRRQAYRFPGKHITITRGGIKTCLNGWKRLLPKVPPRKPTGKISGA